MSDCCTARGYRQIFSEGMARVEARRYRRRGLDSISSRIVKLIGARAGGATVLEVGGGIGAVQLELLKAGASAATSVELTPTYEDEASALLRETGFEDRARRLVMDFAENGADVDAADVVVLNRVLCCYPDMPKLAGAAAEHARRLLVLSFPKERLWTRLAVGAVNLGFWITRREFHMFLHAPAAIRAVARQHGLHAVYDRSGLFWELAAFER